MAVHEDAGLVQLVVHVAADMAALLDDEHAPAAALGQLARRHGPGKAAADDHGVEIALVKLLKSQ